MGRECSVVDMSAASGVVEIVLRPSLLEGGFLCLLLVPFRLLLQPIGRKSGGWVENDRRRLFQAFRADDLGVKRRRARNFEGIAIAGSERATDLHVGNSRNVLQDIGKPDA